MASELAFVLINPYTIAKSRTGGVIGRFLSRTGLNLVAARMFAPSRELVEKYAALVEQYTIENASMRHLFADYLLRSYTPNHVDGRPRRVFMLLFEGEDAVRKIKQTAGSVKMGSGESIRDTYGDYIVDENNQVQYFEPAVLIGTSLEETGAILKLWASYSESDGGFVHHAADVNKLEKVETTLVLIKPDNFLFPSARPGNIIDVLSRSGLRIVAARVLRMSVAQAEEFYGPIRQNLREKMKGKVAGKAAKALEAEFNMPIPADVITLIEEKLGPALGDEQFNEIIKFMTGRDLQKCSEAEKNADGLQRSLALVYTGGSAIAIIRNLLGTTDPTKADVGSVRREFGSNIMVNAAHASDSAQNAEREIRIVGMSEDTMRTWVEKYYGI